MTALASLALAAALVPSAGAAEPRALYRASAVGTAIHGFYDHEGLFPVPILNVSVPYTEATYEPGPTTSALGSFLWNPQAAELGTIVCVLSEGRFCEVPEYPFQARAAYPAAGSSQPPPTVSVDEPGAPLRVRAAHERADADARGAGSEAEVAGFAAVPMTDEQLDAARGLALAAAPFARQAPEMDRWLIAIGDATSRSSTRTANDGAVAESRAVLHDVTLLGGVVRIDVVRGKALAVAPRSARARAES
ncbi:MAG TPA: hypothetical protein VG709_05975, partial [Actinomycetota bacterium]|nr:hypothetical protein [Actinomycetota bacterium]